MSWSYYYSYYCHQPDGMIDVLLRDTGWGALIKKLKQFLVAGGNYSNSASSRIRFVLRICNRPSCKHWY